jgi:hypothetical protein
MWDAIERFAMTRKAQCSPAQFPSLIFLFSLLLGIEKENSLMYETSLEDTRNIFDGVKTSIIKTNPKTNKTKQIKTDEWLKEMLKMNKKYYYML